MCPTAPTRPAAAKASASAWAEATSPAPDGIPAAGLMWGPWFRHWHDIGADPVRTAALEPACAAHVDEPPGQLGLVVPHELVKQLDHLPTRRAVTAERALLLVLGGGCQVPVGAHATVQDGQVHLTAIVARPDGSQVVRGQLLVVDAVGRGQHFHGHQVFHHQLVSDAEQGAVVAVLFAAGVGECGPRGVLGGGFDLRFVFVFVGEPAVDVFEEALLGEAFAEQRFEFGGEGGAVDGVGLLFLDAADGLLLDELALEGEHRRQVVMARLQGFDLRLDAEQFADEVFDVRREGDDQFAGLLAIEAGGVLAGFAETCAQAGVGVLQLMQERGVEADGSFAGVEVLKGEPERKF